MSEYSVHCLPSFQDIRERPALQKVLDGVPLNDADMMALKLRVAEIDSAVWGDYGALKNAHAEAVSKGYEPQDVLNEGRDVGAEEFDEAGKIGRAILGALEKHLTQVGRPVVVTFKRMSVFGDTKGREYAYRIEAFRDPSWALMAIHEAFMEDEGEAPDNVEIAFADTAPAPSLYGKLNGHCIENGFVSLK